MTLTEYLNQSGQTQAEVGEGIDRDQSSVHRYCKGRIPDREAMVRLYHFTGGLVTPNDWYGIGARPAPGTDPTAIPPFEDISAGAAT